MNHNLDDHDPQQTQAAAQISDVPLYIIRDDLDLERDVQRVLRILDSPRVQARIHEIVINDEPRKG
jgi:hypothetical protein